VSQGLSKKPSGLPILPKDSGSFQRNDEPDARIFRYHSARYDIRVANPHGVCRGIVLAQLDGVALPGNQARVSLADDGTTHCVRVVLGAMGASL
jgi:hypothetical protein